MKEEKKSEMCQISEHVSAALLITNSLFTGTDVPGVPVIACAVTFHTFNTIVE